MQVPDIQRFARKEEKERIKKDARRCQKEEDQSEAGFIQSEERYVANQTRQMVILNPESLAHSFQRTSTSQRD